jgi:hypothetical protein
MTHINEKKREAELQNALKEGIVVALHTQGKSYQGIARIVDDSYNYVSRIIVRDIELAKRFNLEIVEKINEAARKILDNKTYRVELERLAESARQKTLTGQVLSNEAIDIFYKKAYAEGMMNLLMKLNNSEPAYILKYQYEVIEPKKTLEGRLMVIPKTVLPTSVRDTKTAKRPYLALGYEKGFVELCNEDAGMLVLKISAIGKTHPRLKKNTKKPVPFVQALQPEQVRTICIDYFKRNGYDLGMDLHKQIQARTLDLIAPVALQKRIQLTGNGLYRNSSV